MEYTTTEMQNARRARLEGAKASYRFMSVDTCLNGISRDSLWISDPDKFNDPFDLEIVLKDLTTRGPFGDEPKLRKAFGELFLENEGVKDFWFYDEELIAALHSWIRGTAHHMAVINQFKRRVSHFGVSCFTPDWNVPLMWSHYANSHGGVCVEWVINPTRFAAEPGNVHLAQYPVRYMTELPTICLSELLFSPHQVLPSFLASKHSDWAYEKEWRLVNFEAKGRNISMPKHMSISAIIIGLDFDDALLSAFIEKA